MKHVLLFTVEAEWERDIKAIQWVEQIPVK